MIGTKWSAKCAWVARGLLAGALLSGCASAPRPAELESASALLNQRNAQELEALRPKLIREAREALRRAEAAYEQGDVKQAERLAIVATQKFKTAENFVARDSAAELAKVMEARRAGAADREQKERDELARLQTLDERIRRLTQELEDVGKAGDAALQAAKRGLIEAKRKQAEAIGAGAPSLAADPYKQGVSLLEGSVDALELGMVEESSSNSSSAIVAFNTAIEAAGVARNTPAAPDEDADARLAADAAIVEAMSAKAGAIGAGAPSKAPARYGQGEALLASAERRFQSKDYRAAFSLAKDAVGAFERAQREVEATPVAARGADPGDAASYGTSRVAEMLRAAEDARADALARGGADHPTMPHGVYLLEVAQQSMAAGDAFRALEKSREARAVFGRVAAGAAALAFVSTVPTSGGDVRQESDRLIVALRFRRGRLLGERKDESCRSFREADAVLELAESRFAKGDYAGALEFAVRATERMDRCDSGAGAGVTSAATQPSAVERALQMQAEAKQKRAAAAIQTAQAEFAAARVEHAGDPRLSEPEALLANADQWYGRGAYEQSERLAAKALESIRRIHRSPAKPEAVAPSPVLPPAPPPGADKQADAAALALENAQRKYASVAAEVGADAPELVRPRQLIEAAERWLGMNAHARTKRMADEAFALLVELEKGAGKAVGETGPDIKGDPASCLTAQIRIREGQDQLERVSRNLTNQEKERRAQASGLVAVAERRVKARECGEATELAEEAIELSKTLPRAASQPKKPGAKATTDGRKPALGKPGAKPGIDSGPSDGSTDDDAYKGAYEAITQALSARDGASSVVTPAMQSTFNQGVVFLANAEREYEAHRYGAAESAARSAKAQFDAVRAAAGSPEVASPPTVVTPAAPARDVSNQAEIEILKYKSSSAAEAAPSGWEDPYRKVVRALSARDRARPFADTAAEKATMARGVSLLSKAQADWAAKDLAAAGALADAATAEFASIQGSATPDVADVKPGPTPPPGADPDDYRASDAAIREALVLLAVCTKENCAERDLESFARAKATVASSERAFSEGRFEYAEELAKDAKDKLLAVLGQEAVSSSDDAETLKLHADDAIREATVTQKVCVRASCASRDVEAWLRAESDMGAARAAYAEGSFKRAREKAERAEKAMRKILEATPTAKAGLEIPPGVSGIQVQGDSIVVSPAFDFVSGSATLTPASRSSVQNLAAMLKHNADKIASVSLVGFTDDRGNPALNQRLSDFRAKAVKDALASSGVGATLTSEGRGPDSPIADNSTAEGRKQNRRVEIHVQLK